jgi:hypothetical protein
MTHYGSKMGGWVLNEIIKKIYTESLKKMFGVVCFGGDALGNLVSVTSLSLLIAFSLLSVSSLLRISSWGRYGGDALAGTLWRGRFGGDALAGMLWRLIL